MLQCTFRAFRAVDDPETCRKFLEGHVKVLTDYGITNITTNNAQWMSNPSVYGVVAELGGVIVGGIRVHVVDGVNPLPVELAVGKMDPRIHDMINEYSTAGTGELCGLWNAKAVAGVGISLLLVRAGIAIVRQFNVESLFTICADYTLPLVRRVGFVIESSIGDNGMFIYPNEKYVARVLRKVNVVTLETAEPFDRERIFDLRARPEQMTLESGYKGDLTVQYALQIPQPMVAAMSA